VVPYTAKTDFLPVENLHTTGIPIENHQPTAFLSPDDNYNGVLRMEVYSKLTSPVVGETIRFHVFVQGCDDLEFAVPTNGFGSDLIGVAPVYQMLAVDSADPDCEEKEETLGKPNPAPFDPYTVYFGEKIVSMRPMLRRFQGWRRENARNSGGGDILSPNGLARTAVVSQTRARFPAFPKYGSTNTLPSANYVLDQTSSGTVGVQYYTYAQTTLLHYLRPCFLGYKGSIRYKIVSYPLDPSRGVTTTMLVRRRPHGSSPIATRFNTAFSDDFNGGVDLSNSGTAYYGLSTMLPYSGGALSVISGNNGLKFQLPDYNNTLVQSCRNTRTLGSPFDRTETDDTFTVLTRVPVTSRVDEIDTGGGNYVHQEWYVAAGEDFSFYKYLNAPPQFSFLMRTPNASA
jgi:hypothetical protein